VTGMSLFEELKRRNVFKVAFLYVVAAWLTLQVADLLFEALDLPATWLRLVLALLILGFPFALIFSWIFEMTPEGLKREKDVDRTASVTTDTGRKINILIAVLLVLAIAVVAIDRLVPEAPAPEQQVVDETAPEGPRDPSALVAEKFAPAPDRSIAVLPFANMSGDDENEYFADGLSEEILNFLAGVPDLQVTARTSSFQFKGKNMDVREVARTLDVAHVLEGSVRRSGDRARITAQLIRASDGYHLWSETYDRTLENTFEVQTDIAESVTRALGVVMDEARRQKMLNEGVRDVEAFIAFQKGRVKFMEAHSDEVNMTMMAEAGDLFGEAIRREPRFASAYFLRSDLYAHRTTMDGISDTERQTAYAEYMADLAAASEYARSPAEKAVIDVDRALASANWGPLPERISTALAADRCIETVWLEVVPPFGYAEESLSFRTRMIECDPLNFYTYFSAGQSAMWAGRPEQALAWAMQALDFEPEEPFLEAITVASLVVLGRLDEARERAESSDLWNREILLTLVDAASGNAEQAREAAARALAEAGQWSRRYLAVELNAIVGNRQAANQAAAWLDSIPAGQLILAATVMECMCGAPFDLEATPVFAKRLEEAGFPWPPADIMQYPTMRE
jgi:adenylate cyclase